MITIPLKIRIITTEANQTLRLDTKDILIQIIRYPQMDQGIDLVEMRKAISILDKLENAKDNISLEQAEHEYILGKLKGHRWKIAHSAILEMVSDIEKG